MVLVSGLSSLVPGTVPIAETHAGEAFTLLQKAVSSRFLIAAENGVIPMIESSRTIREFSTLAERTRSTRTLSQRSLTENCWPENCGRVVHDIFEPFRPKV